MTDPIRVKLTPKEPQGYESDPRKQFWSSIGQRFESSKDLSQLEGKICRELSSALRTSLIREFSVSLDEIMQKHGISRRLDVDYLLMRERETSESERFSDRAAIVDSVLRSQNETLRILQSMPEFQSAQQKILIAAGVFFSVKLAGYASLNLEISIGGLSALTELFDREFDTFKVFFDALVPNAFDSTFYHSRNLVDFSVQIPNDLKAAFTAVPKLAFKEIEAPALPSPPPLSVRASEKAEWVWKIANGSLLIPVLLSLAVVYYGLTILREMRTDQNRFFLEARTADVVEAKQSAAPLTAIESSTNESKK